MKYIRGNNPDYKAASAGKGSRRTVKTYTEDLSGYSTAQLNYWIRKYDRAAKRLRNELKKR